ncbi:MAG: hypothetical protein ACRBCT_07340 [Alphaproteobacteria bacterium]
MVRPYIEIFESSYDAYDAQHFTAQPGEAFIFPVSVSFRLGGTTFFENIEMLFLSPEAFLSESIRSRKFLRGCLLFPNGYNYEMARSLLEDICELSTGDDISDVVSNLRVFGVSDYEHPKWGVLNYYS